MISAIANHKTQIGFTLIELLVVITIIVVLLALLTPALDKAIYQAELTVCGAQLKGVATGVQTYAMHYRRHYPHREMTDDLSGGTFWSRPDYLRDPTANIDDRYVIREAIDLDLLVDPLAGKIDLDPEDTMDDSNVHSTVALRFSFKFAVAGGGSGMFRIGDKVTWAGKRFSALAHDWDIIGQSSNLVTNTHPDHQGVMHQVVVQDTGGVDFRYLPGSGDDAVRYTFARWQSPTTWQRGPVDHNFSFDDGSVRRFDDIDVGGPNLDETDERMDKVPVGGNGEAWTGGTGGWWSLLPQQ